MTLLKLPTGLHHTTCSPQVGRLLRGNTAQGFSSMARHGEAWHPSEGSYTSTLEALAPRILSRLRVHLTVSVHRNPHCI